jgi:hypothetical protein
VPTLQHSPSFLSSHTHSLFALKWLKLIVAPNSGLS